jgi:hypothetical protein
MSNVVVRLRELIEDPETGISTGFLRELLEYILSLERRLSDDGK